MDVRMPDGTIIRNVPAGTTQADLESRLAAYRAPKAKAPTAADEYGPLQAGVVAAGRTLDRLGKGVKQMALNVPAAMGHKASADELSRMAAEEAENTRLFQQLEQRRPVATTLGGAAPFLVAPAMGAGVAGMAAGGAIPGLVEYGTPEERLTRGGMGAAGGFAGGLLGATFGKLLKPTKGVPDRAVADAVEAAERIGYKVPAGQQTGSKALQMVEQQLAKNPVSSGRAQVFNEANQQAINRAAARAQGETANKLTDDVLEAARNRVGQAFDDISARNTVTVSGQELFDNLVRLEQQQLALGKFAQPKVSALVDKGLDLAAKGAVNGKTYQTIRSELGKQAQSAYANKNSTLGDALKSIQRTLDDAADASISAADREAWKTARSQWQAIKLVNTANGIVEGGNVSAAKLATKVDKAGRVNAQELRDIAKVGETFKPLADSGTASNLLTQALISGGAGLAGPGALAATLIGPSVLSKAMFSDAGRKYLTQGLLDLTPEQIRLLKLVPAGLLSASATSAAP